MPIPKPRKKETQEEFIKRFVSDEEMVRDYPDRDQRLAIAFDEWRKKRKKGGDELNLEIKGFELDIKSIDEKGIFEGTASPFDNVDLGSDRVLKSIIPRNENKTIPYLWQHDSKDIIGEVVLFGTENGMNFKGKLYLETLENGQPAIPDAWKAYTLMKNKRLKNSIGYKAIDFDYVTEGKETVRNLKDIDIMELSAVTFPMNPEAEIHNIKSIKEGDDLELKERIEKLEEELNALMLEKKEEHEIDKAIAMVRSMDVADKRYRSLHDFMMDKLKKHADEKGAIIELEAKELEIKEALAELYETTKKKEEE